MEQEVNLVKMGNRRSRQSGGAKLKALIITALLIAGIYSAYKLVPVYFAEFQFADGIQEQARFGVVGRYTEEQIRDKVFKIAQDLEIPVKREDIKVSSSIAIVKISAEYTVPVDLGFYKLDLHFSPSSENKSIMTP